MFKAVGTSGQISLGKKFAGQLFDVQFLDTGVVQMLPVSVVPRLASISGNRRLKRSSDSHTDSNREQWEQENAHAIAAFNQRIEQMGSPAMRLHAWRESKHGAI